MTEVPNGKMKNNAEKKTLVRPTKNHHIVRTTQFME